MQEAYVIDQQADMERWWGNNKGPLVQQGFALEDLQHALGVVSGGAKCTWVLLHG